jgi:molybdate transport system substrate-binding protein
MCAPALCLCIVAVLGASACRGARAEYVLHVACASNLTNVMPLLARSYSVEVPNEPELRFSFGATANLTQQIENGAPFDVFLAADTEHVDQLRAARLTRTEFWYAQGRLAVYAPDRVALQGLANPQYRYIAIANPDLAPFGQASREALQRAGLWTAVQPRIVYTHNISEVVTLVDTGNVEAGLTSLSLIPKGKGTEVDPLLYRPINQAGGVLAHSELPEAAQAFASFLTSKTAQRILHDAGYGPAALK